MCEAARCGSLQGLMDVDTQYRALLAAARRLGPEALDEFVHWFRLEAGADGVHPSLVEEIIADLFDAQGGRIDAQGGRIDAQGSFGIDGRRWRAVPGTTDAHGGFEAEARRRVVHPDT